MYLKRLQYLQAVIDTGSFAAAARQFGVSQPAITMAIQSLERQWGIALFEKVGRQKLPTQAALLAARRAADLRAQIDGLARAPSALPDDVMDPGRAILKVGMAPVASLLYGPIVERIWHAHEAQGLLQIVATGTTPLLTSLHAGELDFVLAPKPRHYPLTDLHRQLLHRSTPVILARTGHPLSGASSLEELAQVSWGVVGQQWTAGSVIEEAHRVRGLAPPKIMVQCADYPSLLNLVAQSDLLCVVPHPMLMANQPVATVAPVLVREGLPQYDVYLFWLAGGKSRQSVAMDAVILALRQFVAGHGEH